MGSCSSHCIVEIKIRSVSVNIKVPQLKKVTQSSILKRRNTLKTKKELGNRKVLTDKNF